MGREKERNKMRRKQVQEHSKEHSEQKRLYVWIYIKEARLICANSLDHARKIIIEYRINVLGESVREASHTGDPIYPLLLTVRPEGVDFAENKYTCLNIK